MKDPLDKTIDGIHKSVPINYFIPKNRLKQSIVLLSIVIDIVIDINYSYSTMKRQHYSRTIRPVNLSIGENGVTDLMWTQTLSPWGCRFIQFMNHTIAPVFRLSCRMIKMQKCHVIFTKLKDYVNLFFISHSG